MTVSWRPESKGFSRHTNICNFTTSSHDEVCWTDVNLFMISTQWGGRRFVAKPESLSVTWKVFNRLTGSKTTFNEARTKWLQSTFDKIEDSVSVSDHIIDLEIIRKNKLLFKLWTIMIISNGKHSALRTSRSLLPQNGKNNESWRVS